MRITNISEDAFSPWHGSAETCDMPIMNRYIVKDRRDKDI